MPGVLGVYTAADLSLADDVGFAGTPEHLRPPLAKGKVRFVGDIVAAVVAENRYQAVDAAETVVVDYDALPAVTNMEASLAGGTLLFEEKGSNVAFATAHGADVDALEGADSVAKARILSQRLAGVPMEPNGCVAVPDGAKMTFYCSTQAAHAVHGAMAGLPRLRAGGSPGHRPLGRRRVRPQGRLLRRVHHRRRRSQGARPAGEVDRDPQREPAVDGPRPRLHHGRRTGREERRHDRGHEGQRDRRRRRLPDGWRGPAHAHPDDEPGRLRHPQDQLQRHHRAHQQDLGGRLPRRRAARGHPDGRADHRRGRRPDRHGPRRAPPQELPAARRFPLTTGTGANYDSGEYEKALDMALDKSGYAALRAEQARRRSAGDTEAAWASA